MLGRKTPNVANQSQNMAPGLPGRNVFFHPVGKQNSPVLSLLANAENAKTAVISAANSDLNWEREPK
jgi:hypothetical protein